MKFRFLMALVCALICNVLAVNAVYAQTTLYDLSELGMFPSDNGYASAKVSCNPQLMNVESGIIEANKKRHNYGYSVQIFFDSGVDAQKKAEAVVEKFKKDCDSGADAYVFYEAPYFKVRAGNCRSRLEATKLKKSIEMQFPGCFIIECKIQYPKL